MNSGIFVKSIDDFAGHQLEYETSDTVMVWGKTSKPLKLASGATHFGYVISGSAKLRLKDGRHYDLIQGMYFSVPNECMIEGGEGIVFSKSDFHGVFLLGGPLCEDSTLEYLPGCVDSILIPPIFRGDPCLNFLNTTKGTLQPVHTHPSYRIGFVISGYGWEVSDAPKIITELKVRDIFFVAPWQEHAFETRDADLKFIVFHPNSDYGPTKDDHPLINQTFVNGHRANLAI